MHCVYILNVILSICRMSLLLKHESDKSLCLYSECHYLYMPDVILYIQESSESECVYIPDVILSICRMSLLFKKAVEVHCVYIPDVTVSIYAGCYSCLTKVVKVHCV